MKKSIVLLICFFVFIACSEDSVVKTIETPDNYSFTNEGESSVAFSDQTTMIAMAEEIVIALLETSNSEEKIAAMFSHIEGESDFSDTDLNASELNLRDNVADSVDFFLDEETDAKSIKEDLDGFITYQVSDVFANTTSTASIGISGQLEDIEENTIRYVNGQGIELNEFFNKALIGGLFVDQILNNQLSSFLLDADDNVQDNDDDILVEGENYTATEHAWDEAYGFLSETDSFLNNAISEVDQEDDFTGIAEEIYDAFILGRAAIVAKDYDVREVQTEIIKEKISLVIAQKTVASFESGISLLEVETDIDYGAAFHQLSEGLGYLYSLQFTREPRTTSSPSSYFTMDEITVYFADILDEEKNGLWEDDIIDTLQDIIAEIELRFDYEEEEELTEE